MPLSREIKEQIRKKTQIAPRLLRLKSVFLIYCTKLKMATMGDKR